jgi:hypothetical protein
MDKSHAMEGDYRGQRWTTWFLWKEGVKPSDILCQLAAVCREKAIAHSTVFNCVWSCNSGRGTVQVAIHGWYHSTPTEAPKKMVVVHNLGGESIELAVVNIQPKGNKICKWGESKSWPVVTDNMFCPCHLAIFRSWKFFKCAHKEIIVYISSIRC